jgi:hypothetical protein
MRANNISKTYSLIVLITVIFLARTNDLAAQEATRQNQETPPPIPSADNPEYKIKTLPNDTFKPSEKISEDFPVPFPVDI